MKEEMIIEDAVRKDALFSLIERYAKEEPTLMVRHFHMMLAIEGIKVLKEDNAKLVEQVKDLKAIIRNHQSLPVGAS